ncbi:hypothetical protein ACHAXA_004440 [Cyclostephanos tholiformis]|uniref:Peptidase S9 prolyl oligopeptidase catalytic domain-containing protein n=1 Tax=Cyclostephanos tholiformis TaxID=382380 RepID=A0ABD3SBX3_9STRA
MQRTAILESLLLLSSSTSAFLPPHPIGGVVFPPRRVDIMTAFPSTQLADSNDADDAVATAVIDRPYGAWESPITSRAITAGSVRLGPVYFHDGEVYWVEGRPMEGGRNVLCRRSRRVEEGEGGGTAAVLDVTPPGSNVRTRVHEYGGGAVVLGKDGNEVYYSDFATQGIRRVVDDDGGGGGVGKSIPITSEYDGGGGDHIYRFADGVLSGDGATMYSIREYHPNGGKTDPREVVNELVSINVIDGSMKVIATGNDFYASPRLSPDGTKLAYVTWDHPNMPWDATELRVVDIVADDDDVSGPPLPPSSISDEHALIAGGDGDTSVIQPRWHPITGELYYLSDMSGYYNIYRSEPDDTTTPVLPMKYDFGGSAPGWTLGQVGYAFLDDGRLVAQYAKDGRSVLVVADVVDVVGEATNVREYGGEGDGLPDMLSGIVPGVGSDLYFLGGSPGVPSCVYVWNLDDDRRHRPAAVIARSSNVTFPEDVISHPEMIEFPTTLGTAYGYYYPPRNGKYVCTTDVAPPLLVKAHGGPTACTGPSFNAGIQYWTSRGFAVLDVDYGGSTGYGREYRRRLRKSWGIVDVDDVCNGAKYLVERGLADGDRLCIDGGSAGGYTTLSALAFRDVFRAGTSLYGVADLTALAGDTHKFESRYLDGLVGAYPEDERIYRDRSPIESVDTLSCPILLLQGAEDKVVPPNQAVMMHEALLKKGIPTCLKIYDGEQHGFRKAEHIEDAIDSELAFYGKVFGIEDIPGAIELEVDNL